jgi:glutaconate CoA-transferase, subunit B
MSLQLEDIRRDAETLATMPECTFGEAMIYTLARTIEDRTLVFHGFGSPLVQLAMHVAKRTHAPDMVLVAGATYGLNPQPGFLTPTSNDWVLDRGAEASLDIEELFDLGGSGRIDRMFLSGLQIDRWGNANVTRLGHDSLDTKLPGGGGGNLSCDVERITLWTPAQRSAPDRNGRRRHRIVERCDFITSLGHRAGDGRTRAEFGHRGKGPQWLVTDLGLFDFDPDGHLRLCGLYPDTTRRDVEENTGFPLVHAHHLETVPLPGLDVVALIRSLDPLGVHLKELQPADRQRRFAVSGAAMTARGGPAGGGRR